MRRLLKPLWILLALVFLFEAWLWEHLRPLVGWFVDLIAWDKAKARVAACVEHLPPYPTLLVFLIPVILLFRSSCSACGCWRTARGSARWRCSRSPSSSAWASRRSSSRSHGRSCCSFGWFRWFYEHMLVWLAKAHALVDPIKTRIKHAVRRYVWLLKPGRPSRFLRHIARIRRRVQAQPAE